MRSSAGGLLALVMLAVLTACGSTGPQPGSGGTGTLSGIVRAPAGGDVQGTLVEACFVTGTQCDDASPQTRSVTIQQAGASAPYSISGLADGMYGLFACRDMNGNNQGYQCDDGDFFGFYTTDGQNPQGVEPPDAGLDIQMFVLGTGGGGTSSAGLPPDDGHTTSSFRQSDVAVDDSGITHLLYAGSSADGASSPVRYGECSAQCLSSGSWRFVTLGDFGSPGLGGGARLALDADGHPRVLWYQQASVNGDGAYVYGACDGGCTTTSNWSVQPVVMVPGGMASALTNASFVLDGQGRPRFVFMDLLNGVTYAWCDSGCTDGTNWQLARPTPTATGSELSSTLDLAFDAGGRLHAAYEGIALDNNGIPINVLGYAVCDGGCDAGANWQVVPLLSMDFGSNGPFSLALTAEGGPRLVFYDGNSLAYVWCDADCTDPANWGGAQTGLPQYSGQSGVDLALDASGNPVLAYSGASDTVSVDSANVAACTSACQTSTASWTSEVIETYQDINTSPPDPCLTGKSYWQLGQAPSLALDDAGVAHVSYATFSGGTCPAGHDDQGNRYEEVFELNGPLRYAQP